MTAAIVTDTLTSTEGPALRDARITLSPPVRPIGRPTKAIRTGRKPYLAPVPDSEPPFDDELDLLSPARRQPAQRSAEGPELTEIASAARTLAPRQVRRGHSPGLHRPSSNGTDLTLTTASRPTTITAHGIPPWSSEADIGVRKTATQDLPPASRMASVLARALVEVLSGRRSLEQLRVHCAPEIYAGLGERMSTTGTSLPHLLTVRVCEPADGVAEVSAAYRLGNRVRALAFRIQGVDGRWRITALQVG